MNEMTPPVPTLKTLFISSVFATILASIILMVAVLPAEYGIDPTGLGKAMGLTVLAPAQKSAINVETEHSQTTNADISIKVVDPKVVEEQMALLKQESSNAWKDTVTVIIPPMKGKEYKFFLEKDVTLGFEWKTENGEKLHFDFHGEPKGDKTGYFKSFKLSTDSQSSGTLTTPFAGSHGWYWENKTRLPIKVFLKTKGDYQILGLM